MENVMRQKMLKKNRFIVWAAVLAFIVLGVGLLSAKGGPGTAGKVQTTGAMGSEKFKSLETEVKNLSPGEMIRFHVLANSDSDYDQALKRAVRDAILKRLSPSLAASKSLAQSQAMLKGLLPEMQSIAEGVVKAWGKNYPVQAKFGPADFPTKSYGSLVLPAGEYQAVRILIGRAEGSNWWCVLFPPLCFVDIDHSTAVQVDGKAGIPLKHGQSAEPEFSVGSTRGTAGTAGTAGTRGLGNAGASGSTQDSAGAADSQGTAVPQSEVSPQSNVSSQSTAASKMNKKPQRPVVKFWIWEELKKLFHF